MTDPANPEQWEDEKPHPQGHTREQEEDAEGSATAGVLGLGCLGFSLIPLTLAGIVILFLFVLWALHSHFWR